MIFSESETISKSQGGWGCNLNHHIHVILTALSYLNENKTTTYCILINGSGKFKNTNQSSNQKTINFFDKQPRYLLEVFCRIWPGLRHITIDTNLIRRVPAINILPKKGSPATLGNRSLRSVGSHEDKMINQSATYLGLRKESACRPKLHKIFKMFKKCYKTVKIVKFWLKNCQTGIVSNGKL